MFRCLVSAFFVIVFSVSALPPPDRSYKVLMLLPVSSISFRNVFMPLANALADRGHEVTMLSNHGLNNPKIKHFQLGFNAYDFEKVNMFHLISHPEQMMEMFEGAFVNISKKMWDDPSVKMLYKNRRNFDLIVFNHIENNIVYPFAHNHTFIVVSTYPDIDFYHSAVMGNFLNPAYVSNMETTYQHPFSFVDKLNNIYESIMTVISWHKYINEPAQEEVSKRFPELPSLLEIEANVSLSLLNSHFSFGQPVPILPNQVEVGGMHCRPAEPLPKDLENFLSGSTPVVYMSLGSIARSESMPQKFKDVFIETFSKLPYKVLWKYEDESIKGLPENVMIKKWMPQQDILAHPNVKVFITHCGGLGMQEALYHGTPMIGLPMFIDQHKNGMHVELAGTGKVLLWEELSYELLSNSIQEIISNPRYQEKISAVSTVFKDQPQTPVERAVYWTEYVIRHKGATHLRSPELDLSWIQLLHLDILLLVHISVFLFYKVCCKVIRFCFPVSSQRHKVKGE